MTRISRAYTTTNSTKFVNGVIILVIFGLIITTFSGDSTGKSGFARADKSTLRFKSESDKIKLATWNIAAINNNPFEYWITWNDKRYINMMENMSKTIKEPPKLLDVPVQNIFTDKMYNELEEDMRKAGFTDLEKVRNYWENEYKNRKILSEFIKDSTIGKKRLASMPDRVTNTIEMSNNKIIYRPTVINCYDKDLASMDEWWKNWKAFIFGGPSNEIYKMFKPIKKSKYPAITTDEAAVSLPLQTLCLAIFDATLVHVMNYLAPTEWQPLRKQLCHDLNIKKSHRTVEILENSYSDSEVIFLQEVGKAFVASANSSSRFMKDYAIHTPINADPNRDQNSLIVIRHHCFKEIKDVTLDVLGTIGGKSVPVAPGDLIVLTAQRNSDNVKYILASFHGDTNGLATKPIVQAVRDYALNTKPDHKLLFGMDANTYAHPENDQQGVTDFAEFYTQQKLNSCYGPKPDPENFTTFHARTYLQPQLNKAIAYSERDKKGDKNPKDFIIFFAADFIVDTVAKDNTGEKKYIEGMVFPTLNFPSDHGVTSTTLVPASNRK